MREKMRKEIPVLFVNEASQLLKCNTLPTENLLSKAKKVNEEYSFKIDKDVEVSLSISDVGVYTKKIKDKKKLLIIPNYIRYIRRNSFSKNKNGLMLEKKYEILELRWFFNKRNYYTVSNNFMFEFAKIKSLTNQFLFTPTNEDKEKILDFFEKEKNIKINHKNKILKEKKDLLNYIKDLEKSNNSHKGFLNLSKRIDEFISHGNFTGLSLPAQKIALKDNIEINSDYKIENIELLFTENGFIIDKLYVVYKDIIKFIVNQDETGIFLIISSNNYGIGIDKDKDGRYFTKINYDKSFPFKINSIQLPSIYATLGKKHNFTKPNKASILIPRNVKKYKEFSEQIKNDYDSVYSTILYIYRIKFKDYKIHLRHFVNKEIDETMSESEVYEILNLNYQNFNDYYEKIEKNVRIYKEIIKIINNYNKNKINELVLNEKMKLYNKQLVVI